MRIYEIRTGKSSTVNNLSVHIQEDRCKDREIECLCLRIISLTHYHQKINAKQSGESDKAPEDDMRNEIPQGCKCRS